MVYQFESLCQTPPTLPRVYLSNIYDLFIQVLGLSLSAAQQRCYSWTQHLSALLMHSHSLLQRFHSTVCWTKNKTDVYFKYVAAVIRYKFLAGEDPSERKTFFIWSIFHKFCFALKCNLFPEASVDATASGLDITVSWIAGLVTQNCQIKK